MRIYSNAIIRCDLVGFKNEKSDVTKAYNWVNAKLNGTELNAFSAERKLFGTKTCRQELNKQQDNFVTLLVDSGYLNYYNITRILNGKVKAFPGKTPKERILTAIEGLYELVD